MATKADNNSGQQYSMLLKDLKVVVYPELVAAAIQAKERELYVIWSVMRACDANRSQKRGLGLAHVSFILGCIERILGVSSKHAFTVFNKGVGKYWHAPSGKMGKRRTGLVSLKKIVDRLQPSMPRAHPFELTIQDLLSEGKGSGHIKSLLTGVVASRYGGERPVAMAAVVEQLGVSKATAKRHLKQCPHVRKLSNWCRIYSHKDNAMATAVYQRILNNNIDKDQRAYRLSKVGDEWVVMQQLGNSYLMPEHRRLRLSHRPKELKIATDISALKPSVYRPVARPLSDDGGRVWYTREGRVKSDNYGTICLWKPHNLDVSEYVPAVPQAGSRIELYMYLRSLPTQRKELREIDMETGEILSVSYEDEEEDVDYFPEGASTIAFIEEN